MERTRLQIVSHSILQSTLLTGKRRKRDDSVEKENIPAREKVRSGISSH